MWDVIVFDQESEGGGGGNIQAYYYTEWNGKKSLDNSHQAAFVAQTIYNGRIGGWLSFF